MAGSNASLQQAERSAVLTSRRLLHHRSAMGEIILSTELTLGLLGLTTEDLEISHRTGLTVTHRRTTMKLIRLY